MGKIEILVPVPPAESEQTTAHFDLGRSLDGVTVGLRLDNSWRSYFTVLDEWTAMLERDGATVERLVVGDRAGPQAEQTRTDVEQWSKLVEVGVVGLGN